MTPTPSDRRLRVLLATDAFPPVCGGSGWSTYELARGLRRLGHDVRVAQPRPGDPPGVVSTTYDGFPVTLIGSRAPTLPFLRNYWKNERLYPRLSRELAALARRDEIDLLHGQHVLTAPAAIRAGAILRRPVVCTVRDYWPVCYWSDLIHDQDADHLCPACTAGGMVRCVRPRAGGAWPLAVPLVPYMRRNLAAKRAALARADAVVAVSSVIAHDLRNRAPELVNTRIEVIPNPVDLDAVAASVAAQSRPVAGPYAVYVGKLEPNKGVRHLVPALAASGLPWPTVIVGDGSLRDHVQEQAASAHVAVTVLGWRPRDEALAWMAHAELLAFPSHGPESLSRVLLEAGALGVPVAAMDTGGTRDIVRHAETGLVSDTPEQFGRDLAHLARDADLRRRLGRAARAHVAQQFAAPSVTARMVRLYESLVGLPERSRG
jgi:glycosyltransferase involved in cell wall biosynthesis